MASEETDLEMLNQLRNSFASALREFAASNTTFRILRTVPLNNTSSVSSAKTLYVLDSSFNPPSKAHMGIAQQALVEDSGTPPRRVLFLLATENADKKPKPADFEDRLVMMTLMAQELRLKAGDGEAPSIDIGVTKKPFFVDKAYSIDESKAYGDEVEQVHLTGFDTLTRIFDKKYYGEKGLKVLEPFLSKDRLRGTFRVEEVGKGEKWGTRKDQEEWVAKIARGESEGDGMKREWAEKITLIDDRGTGNGVSSTEARKAAKEERWKDLKQYVGDGVAGWIRERRLYQEEGSEKKSYD